MNFCHKFLLILEKIKLSKSSDEQDEMCPEVKKMKLLFKKQNTTLIVEGEEIHINNEELMEKSPVFKAMFTSNFKEKNAKQIPLPGKKLKDFLTFLRCTISGTDTKLNSKYIKDSYLAFFRVFRAVKASTFNSKNDI